MAAGLAVVVTLLLASSGMTDHLQQHWRRWAGDPGQACFDHERLSLADPDGARLESQTVGAPDAIVAYAPNLWAPHLEPNVAVRAKPMPVNVWRRCSSIL